MSANLFEKLDISSCFWDIEALFYGVQNEEGGCC